MDRNLTLLLNLALVGGSLALAACDKAEETGCTDDETDCEEGCPEEGCPEEGCPEEGCPA